jgi:phenylacetate-CoA ligase
MEILRHDGSHCAPDEAGEVVVTVLSRLYQPLIRFRLGDVAMWDSTHVRERQMPIIKEVLGRIEDIVVGPDGRQMAAFMASSLINLMCVRVRSYKRRWIVFVSR